MRKLLIALLGLLPVASYAEEINDKIEKHENDTLFTELKNDIVVLSSTKETNSLKSLPAAVSVFSPKNLEGMQVASIKDLSAYVPNFFIPTYGSKMTAPLYIRGIGSRTGSQTVSMYVDNVPYFNPSAFDCELYDIQRIEVLRGTQGTLYGRNSMGGIVNIYTYSPLAYEGTNIALSGGNHGYFSGNLSHYRRLSNTMGISVADYYKRDNGFFENVYKGEKADESETAGGRLKFSWQITPDFYAQYSGSFDFIMQGAFPYMKIGEDNVNFDGPSNYKRRLITNGLTLQYTQPNYVISSITGYQYLVDDMFMDQDYTPASIFSINQKQNQHSLSQEVTIKSNNKSNYQWSNGVFGFYDYQKITSPVLLLEDGIAGMLQTGLDKLASVNPMFPITKLTDDEIGLNGVYRKPTYGAAVFHQSTFNNILWTPGLSFTVGLRLDYENTELKYDARTGANMTVQQQNPAGSPVIPARVDTLIRGKASSDYIELLPKFVLKYQINPQSYMYVSASRGYKTGGHNVQLFADFLSSALQTAIVNPTATAPDVNEMISYDPEYSWNYEMGGNVEIIKNALSANFAFYYIDVKDVQITQFVKTQQGRITTNAGKAVSKGFEIGLKARPCNGFYLYANYGFSDAKFKDYKDDQNDYTNSYIPFAPRQTVSLGGNVSYNFKNKTILDCITFDANFSGVGKIYWNESNLQQQSFYGTVNARLAIEKGIFSLEFWGRNIFDRKYDAFYFELMGNSFVQQGKPDQWGATLRVRL